MAAKKKNPAAVEPADVSRWVDHEELELWEDNPRDNESAVPKVAESLKRYGFVAPVVVWTSKGRLIAGHTRLKAFRRIIDGQPDFIAKGSPGKGLVPVRFHEFESEAEASAYAIADNRLGYEADWDYEKLVPLLESIGAVDPSLLEVTGFHGDEVQALLRSVYTAVPPTPATDEETAKAEAAAEVKASSTKETHTLTFDAVGWAVLKRVIVARTGMVADDPKALGDGLVVLLNELAAEAAAG